MERQKRALHRWLSNRYYTRLILVHNIRCECAVYLSKQGTNGKYQELMLQGHVAAELEDLLSEEMGIPRRFLFTTFTKGAKPRKAPR